MTLALHLGDCLDVMRTMPDASVDAVVTDPPYGLADHPPKEVAACLAAWLAGEPYKPKGEAQYHAIAERRIRHAGAAGHQLDLY